MKEKIIIFMIILMCPLIIAYPEKVLELNVLVYDNDTVNLQDIFVRYGKTEKKIDFEGTHKLLLTDKSENIIYSKDITITFTAWTNAYDDQGKEIYEGSFKFEKSHVYVRAKYLKEYSDLLVYKENKLIFKKEIGSLLCNYNDICDRYENYLSCPADCPLDELDGFCISKTDGVCDPDCEEGIDPDCDEEITKKDIEQDDEQVPEEEEIKQEKNITEDYPKNNSINNSLENKINNTLPLKDREEDTEKNKRLQLAVLSLILIILIILLIIYRHKKYGKI